MIYKPFPVIDEKRDRYFLIMFCLVFSIIFLNVFVPFNINRWFSDSAFIQFLRLSSYGVVVSLVLLFTQFPLRKLFGVRHFTILTICIWIIIEIVLISLVYIFLYGNPVGNFMNDFIFSIRYTLLGIVLPYSIALTILYYKSVRQHPLPAWQFSGLPGENMLISFRDEANKLRFSVLQKDILLIESTDNYVTVWFSHEGKTQRKLLRNTLKTLEQTLEKHAFVRCHRSFMVNMNNVSFVHKQGKKMYIKLTGFDTQVPVSEKYLSRFNHFLSPEERI